MMLATPSFFEAFHNGPYRGVITSKMDRRNEIVASDVFRARKTKTAKSFVEFAKEKLLLLSLILLLVYFYTLAPLLLVKLLDHIRQIPHP